MHRQDSQGRRRSIRKCVCERWSPTLYVVRAKLDKTVTEKAYLDGYWEINALQDDRAPLKLRAVGCSAMLCGKTQEYSPCFFSTHGDCSTGGFGDMDVEPSKQKH